MQTNTKYIQVENLQFGFEEPLMNPLTWTVKPGERWALLGHNGSGKTTLFRTLLGIIPALGGTMCVHKHKRYIAQDNERDKNVPGRVRDVVLWGLDEGYSFLNPFRNYAKRDKLKNVLASLELELIANQIFEELSGGQKQRARLAQALISEPALLFLDESTNAMDPDHAICYYQVLNQYTKASNAAFVAISHHFTDIRNIASHILLFSGKGYEMGTCEEVMKTEVFRNWFAYECECCGV